jgi:RNA polymerase sigma-70 factor (ECF subfamily)
MEPGAAPARGTAVTATADPAVTAGRPASVAELYEGAYARLVGVLTLACGSRGEAEEVVQDAFVRLIPRWGSVSRYEDPEAWVRGVAFRLARSRWRRRVVAARTLPRLGAPSPVEPPTGDAVDAHRVLAALPHKHREVLVLHHALGLPVEQVAADLGLPVGTVKSRLARARAAAAALGGDLDD